MKGILNLIVKKWSGRDERSYCFSIDINISIWSNKCVEIRVKKGELII